MQPYAAVSLTGQTGQSEGRRRANSRVNAVSESAVSTWPGSAAQ
jgi:hypothetical protein